MKIRRLVITLIVFVTCFASTVQCQEGCGMEVADLRYHISSNTCGDVLSSLTSCLVSGDAVFVYHIGLCYRMTEQDSMAIIAFRRAVDLNLPRITYAHLNLANSYAKLRMDSLALDHLQVAANSSTVLFLWKELAGLSALAERNVAAQIILDRDKPSFNHWTVLFIPVILIGFIQAVLLYWRRKESHQGVGYLILLQVAFAIMILSYVLYWTRYSYFYPYFSSWWQAIYFLIGPAIYLYLRCLFSSKDEQRNNHWMHFIPFVLICICILPRISFNCIHQSMWPQWATFIGTHFLIKIAHLIFYLAMSYSVFHRDIQIDDHIKQWTRLVYGFFGLFVASNIVYYLLIHWPGFNPEWDYFISGVMSMSILGIGLFGLIQPNVFKSMTIAQAIVPIKKYRTSGMTAQASASLQRELEELMTVQEVFKENELRLDDLASYLNASKHHVSQVINEHYEKNFFDFVNTYRVNFVAQRLSDPKYEKSTIIQLAFEAGFNNKVSFNRAFKSKFDKTPSAYRKSKKDERNQLRMEREN